MTFKTTLGLFGVLLVLGLYVYFAENPYREEVKTDEKPLISFEASEVTRLDLDWPPTGDAVSFTHDASHPDTPWRMASPIEDIANKDTLSDLVRRLQQMKPAPLVEAQPKTEEVASFGLSQPEVSVRLTLKQTDTEIVHFGANNFSGTQTYVRLGDAGAVYLVPSDIKRLFNPQVSVWLQKR